MALEYAMAQMSLPCRSGDAAELTGAICRMPPFPEVPAALSQLKRMGFKLCIVSNTDRVITAEQAQAYRPSAEIFKFAHVALGVTHRDRNSGRRPLPDYTPDAIFEELDRVPFLFKRLGWC